LGSGTILRKLQKQLLGQNSDGVSCRGIDRAKNYAFIPHIGTPTKNMFSYQTEDDSFFARFLKASSAQSVLRRLRFPTVVSSQFSLAGL
jgi:hypothetical protein